MKLLCAFWIAIGILTEIAQAGSIERRGDPSPILFAEGKNRLEISASTIHPSVSGSPLALGGRTGNIQNSYESYAIGYKHELNEILTFAIVIDEPLGASVSYRIPGAFFSGSSAEISSIAVTGMAKYQATDSFSLYGGLRLQGVGGSIRVVSFGGTFPNPYTLNVDKDYRLGYLAGGAYEIPERALRAAITYESEIKHKFRDNTGTRFEVATPQAVTVYGQTGVAKDTLIFGSARWREWTESSLAPPEFFPNPIVSGTSDIWTYELGIGHRFSPSWSGVAIFGYEKDHGDIVSNLVGSDGYVSYGLTLTYETEDWEITTGIRYFDIGGANSTVSSFSGSDAIAVGTKVSLKF